jgi:putative DNA primase/helicase
MIYSHTESLNVRLDLHRNKLATIHPDIVKERGYLTITEGQLPHGISKTAHKPGLAIPSWGTQGAEQRFTLYRPDIPPLNKKGEIAGKYLFPKGMSQIMDILPSMRGRLTTPHTTLWICESIIKADSLNSVFMEEGNAVMAANVAVAINGVYGWRTSQTYDDKKSTVPLPELSEIPIKNRQIVICFDSDIKTNPKVKLAAITLADYLSAKEATSVSFCILDSDGKIGIDDFIRDGKTWQDIQNCLEPVPTKEKRGADEKKLHFTTNEDESPISNISNVLLAIRKGKGFDDTYKDLFTEQVIFKGNPIKDSDAPSACEFLERTYGFKSVRKDIMSDAIDLVANENKRNTLTDYLNGLQWDGIARIEQSFVYLLGAEDTEYNASISKNFWLMLAARGLFPGCKCDNMIVIEGKQGDKKSVFLKTIGGKLFKEVRSAMSSKDFCHEISGTWIASIAELEAMKSSKSIESIKAIITTDSDHFRPPYGRNVIDRPRQCIFVGTTNQDEYLNDITGNRRFWPVISTKIDIEETKIIKDQCLAEAVKLIKDGDPWWLVPETAKDEQLQRLEHDEWMGRVEDFVSRRNDSSEFSSAEVWTEESGFGRHLADYGKSEQMRVAKCLTKLGFTKSTDSGRKFWAKRTSEPF